MTRAIAIVQARTTSTRLPGKVLRKVGGQTVLAHVLHRAGMVPGIHSVCCAVPEGTVHDPVASEAARAGVAVFRGAEHDVLDRYHRAALYMKAEVVMRITSDCPLIDPALGGSVLALVTGGKADYACNNAPRTWPHGLDCEAFTMHAMALAAREAVAPYDREHVTPWIRGAPNLRRANLATTAPDLADLRWTLDYPEDLTFFEALFRELPSWPAVAAMDDVLAILKRIPYLATINSMHKIAAGQH